MKKRFTLRESGLLGLSQTTAAVGLSFASGHARAGGSLSCHQKQSSPEAMIFGEVWMSMAFVRTPMWHFGSLPNTILSPSACVLSRRSPGLWVGALCPTGIPTPPFHKSPCCEKVRLERKDSSGFHLAAFSQAVNQLVRSLVGKTAPNPLAIWGLSANNWTRPFPCLTAPRDIAFIWCEPRPQLGFRILKMC